jgi:hypothetical protein
MITITEEMGVTLEDWLEQHNLEMVVTHYMGDCDETLIQIKGLTALWSGAMTMNTYVQEGVNGSSEPRDVALLRFVRLLERGLLIKTNLEDLGRLKAYHEDGDKSVNLDSLKERIVELPKSLKWNHIKL